MLMYHCNSKPEHLMASWRWNFFRKSLILRSLLTSASKHLGQYLSYLLNDFMCSSLRIIPHRHRRKFRVALRSTPLGKVKSCRPSQAGSLPAGNAPCGSSLTHHCVSAYLCPLCHAAQVSHTHLSGTWGLLPPGTAGCPLGQRSQHTHDLWSLCSVVRVFLRVYLQERAVSSTLSICSKIRFSPGRILSDLPV